MDSHDASPLPATPPQMAVPPTLPGSVGARQSGAVWPTVVGVIALVLGILAALGGLCGIFSALFIRVVFKLIGLEEELSQDPSLMHLDAWAIPLAVLNVAGLLVASVLIYAAVLTLRRRRTAGAWMNRWSWSKIVLVVVMAAATYMMQTEQMEAVAAAAQANASGSGTSGVAGTSGGGPPAVLTMMTTTMPVLSFFFSVAWGWGLPIFMLIWFGRSKIKQEVAGWS